MEASQKCVCLNMGLWLTLSTVSFIELLAEQFEQNKSELLHSRNVYESLLIPTLAAIKIGSQGAENGGEYPRSSCEMA